MASPTQWTWVWVSSVSQWWTGKPGMLQSKGLQRVRYDWATELKTKQCRKKKMSFSSPWEPQTPCFSSGIPGASLLLGDPGLFINLPGKWLSHPPFSFRRITLPREGSIVFIPYYFLLLRGVILKLLRQHILLTLILSVSDPGAPNNSWRMLWHL